MCYGAPGVVDVYDGKNDKKDTRELSTWGLCLPHMCDYPHLIYVQAFALEQTVILWITLHRSRATIISMFTFSMMSELRFIGKRHPKMFR